MRKIVIEVDTGSCGMDNIYYYEVPVNTTNEALDSLSNDLALDNAEMYGIYPFPENEEVDSEDTDSYSDGIEGSWRDFNPNKDEEPRTWDTM